MFEALVLGVLQGIGEWLPISSEGLIVLAKANFFGGGSFEAMIQLALFLHLGTFFAAFVYFRRDVKKLLRALFKGTHNEEMKKLLRFLLVSTVVSGALGLLLLNLIRGVGGGFFATSRLVNLLVSLMLVVTGVAALSGKKDGVRGETDITRKDGFVLGLVQGLTVLPGLSRSGLTVAALLLRKFQDTQALRLSFLMSLPIVFGGNIVLNFNSAVLTAENIVSLLAAFVTGYATIHVLFAVAKKVNFGYFVLGFAALVLVSVFV